MTNNKQQTVVDRIVNLLNKEGFAPVLTQEEIKSFKEMEKQQSIGLIKQTAMFMAASHLDEEIANMSYEDVYKTYYNETYGGGE